MTIEQCTRPAEKREVVATEEERAKVRATRIEDIVEPLHALPYGEQVEWKKKDLGRVIENYNKQYFRDAEVVRLLGEGVQLPQLQLGEFVECGGKVEGYRSKSEFTIGFNEEGLAVVGFNKGSYHNQTIMVESPRNVRIISKQTKLVVALL
jgi:tRNA (uracil-5-)-methyltransferase